MGRAAKLDYGMAHVVCVARNPNLILNLCEEAIWQWLVKRTTTPIKREWTPWLMRDLIARKKLERPALEIGCNVGICTASSDDVDNLVVAAVRSGKVRVQ